MGTLFLYWKAKGAQNITDREHKVSLEIVCGRVRVPHSNSLTYSPATHQVPWEHTPSPPHHPSTWHKCCLCHLEGILQVMTGQIWWTKTKGCWDTFPLLRRYLVKCAASRIPHCSEIAGKGVQLWDSVKFRGSAQSCYSMAGRQEADSLTRDSKDPTFLSEFLLLCGYATPS